MIPNTEERSEPVGAKEIPNIEDLSTEPVIGETYSVPVVWRLCSAKRFFCPLCTEDWVPITGPMHSDADYIGFEPMHFHYDVRFLQEPNYQEISTPNYHHTGEALFVVITNYCKDRGIQRRDMVCLRAQVPYPSEHAKWIPALSAAYADKKVTCGKCPHRGLPLGSLPREPGTDIVTCVGHGIRVDLKTGKVVR